MSTLSEQQNEIAVVTSDEVCKGTSFALELVEHLDTAQTVPFAEAESITLLHSCVVYALWTTWGKKEPIGAFLASYKPQLVRKIRERFGDKCLDRFKTICGPREVEFMKYFPTIQKDADAIGIAGMWLRRIQGTYDAEPEREGVQAGTDAAAATALFHEVSSSIIANSKLFRTVEEIFR